VSRIQQRDALFGQMMMGKTKEKSVQLERKIIMLNIINIINEIKNYIAVKAMTKDQLEDTVNWLIATANNHFNGIEPLDEEIFAEVGSLFDGLSCDLAYKDWDEIEEVK
jgi:hypothetical protein